MKSKSPNRKLFLPFRSDAYPLISELHDRKECFDVASYKGSGLVGKDIAFSVNKDLCGLIVQDIQNIDFYQINQLIILDSGNTDEDYLGIEDILEKVKSTGGEIIILSPHILRKTNANINFNKEINQNLFDINIPVVFVTGIFDTLYNSITAIKLYNECKIKGINATVYSNDNNLRYLGFDTYNLELMELECSISYLYYYLYRDINHIIEREKVDLIIIQIPGGSVQISENIFNDFGVYCTLFNEIAMPDYIICNMPNDYVSSDYLQEINRIFQYKYHREIDRFIINNYFLKFLDPLALSAHKDDIVYLPQIYSDILLNKYKDNEKIENSYPKIVENIIKKLTT